MTRNCVFFYSWGLLGCLACTPLAAAEEPTPSSATSQHAATSQEGGLRFEVQKGGRSIIAKRIAAAGSLGNWVAAGSAIGPCFCQAESRWAVPEPTPDTWELAAAEVRPGKQGTEEATAHWRRKDGLELSWSAKVSDASGVVEFQSELNNTGTTPIPRVRELGPLGLRLSVKPQDLIIHSVTRNQYQKHVTVGAQLVEIKGGSWNSPESAGWIAWENPKTKEVLFLGVEWESYWTVRTATDKDGAVVSCFLNTQDRDLAPGQRLASPRVFLGVSRGDLDDSLRALHDHLRHIIPPLPANFPWIEYDIWSTDGKGVEDAIRAEIPVAAKLGVELFMHDAGWYEGSAKDGSGDWFQGVGNYAREDRVKYPAGLADLSRRVHAAGMKFGLWFAPQVVDSSLVGTVIPRDFVARRDGHDIALNIDWPPITQICTGNPRVVEHLKKVMGDCVERYHLCRKAGLPRFQRQWPSTMPAPPAMKNKFIRASAISWAGPDWPSKSYP